MIDRITKMAIKNMGVYDGFIFLENPVPFNELFDGKPLDVSLHSSDIYIERDGMPYIIGFCGVFYWDGEKVVSKDGDSYDMKTPILAYDKYIYEGKDCVCVMADNDIRKALCLSESAADKLGLDLAEIDKAVELKDCTGCFTDEIANSIIAAYYTTTERFIKDKFPKAEVSYIIDGNSSYFCVKDW